MRKRINVFFLILIVLFGCQIQSLQVFGQPAENVETEAAGAPSPSPAMVAKGIDEMKELISTQRQQIEKLQSTLDRQRKGFEKAVNVVEVKNNPQLAAAAMTASPTPASAARPAAASQEKVDELELIKSELEAVAESAAQANQRLKKLESDTAANKKETDAKAKQLGNFTFSGDIRARLEPFYQEGAQMRHRDRFRLRFNVTAKISDEFNAGFSLATGTLDDPVSTNQTMTSFFNRKNIGIDKAYISYQPKFAKFLKLDAGKFAYPWYRTGLTFDGDVNPDGFAQTLSFNIKSSVLTNLTIVGFQLPINEVTSGPDSFVYGGQVQAQFRMGSKARLGLYLAGISVDRADPIAVAVGNGSLKPSLSNSNTFKYNSAGTTVTGYATEFTYLDSIVKIELDTHPRFPTTILFDYVNNLDGRRENTGYWAEVTFGKQKEAKDLQFGYSFIRIEKDAVIGAWNESDLRSSTNVRNHKMSVAYMFHSKVTAQFTAWIGKLANPLEYTSLIPSGVRGACTGSSVSDCRDPYLKRLQYDVIYKF